jgi:hypothetical protein
MTVFPTSGIFSMQILSNLTLWCSALHINQMDLLSQERSAQVHSLRKTRPSNSAIIS